MRGLTLLATMALVGTSAPAGAAIVTLQFEGPAGYGVDFSDPGQIGFLTGSVTYDTSVAGVDSDPLPTASDVLYVGAVISLEFSIGPISHVLSGGDAVVFDDRPAWPTDAIYFLPVNPFGQAELIILGDASYLASGALPESVPMGYSRVDFFFDGPNDQSVSSNDIQLVLAAEPTAAWLVLLGVLAALRRTRA
jgi:hypothetical protein